MATGFETPNHEVIRKQNDEFRKASMNGANKNGKFSTTRGVASLPPHIYMAVLVAVRDYDDFEDEGNNIYGENDFGSFGMAGQKFFWKIDYYENSDMEWGAEDPTNCYRLLTIMLADEY